MYVPGGHKKVANTSKSKRRIIAAFVAVIGVLITIVLVNIYSLSKVEQNLDRVVGTNNVQIGIMHQILDLARQRSLTLQHILLSEDPFTVDDQIMEMSDIGVRYLDLREQMQALSLTDRERELLDAQYSQTANTGRIQSKVIGLVSEDEYAAAKKLFYTDAIPSQNKAMTLMYEFIALQDSQNHEELIQTTDEIESQRNLMLILLAIGFVLSLSIASWVTQRIQHEIDRRNLIEDELEHRVQERTRQLEQLARKDMVTSLPNRSAFTEELDSALEDARNSKKLVALFFMDLDGFKLVNDSHGHGHGDKALIAISQRLSSVSEDTGFLARVGGDEFALIIVNANNEAKLKTVADKIIRAVNQPLLIDGQHCFIGISIGCAVSDGISILADELLTLADDAMYDAKRCGKNRFKVIRKHASRLTPISV